MHYAHDERKHHCAVITHYLGWQEYALDGLEDLPLGYIHTEESMEEESYHRGGHSKGDHQRRNVSQNLLQSESQGYQQQPVSRITHAESEEEHEEDGDERSRVETVVGRAAVHVGEQLEHLHELVVPECDRGIILHCGGILEPKYVHCIQALFQGAVILDRGEALEYRKGVLGGVFGCRRCQRTGKVAFEAGKIFAHPGEILFPGYQSGLGLLQLIFQTLDFSLNLGQGPFRLTHFLEGEAGIVSCNYEVNVLAAFICLDYDVGLIPVRVVFLGRNAVEVEFDTGLGQRFAVPVAPNPNAFFLFAKRCQFVFQFLDRSVAPGLDFANQFLLRFNLSQERGGAFIHGSLGTCNVHQPQGLKL